MIHHTVWLEKEIRRGKNTETKDLQGRIRSESRVLNQFTVSGVDRRQAPAVRRAGDRNGRLALHFSASAFLEMITGSRVTKKTERIVSPHGSLAKHLTRHGEWTEARTGGQRAGARPLTE